MPPPVRLILRLAVFPFFLTGTPVVQAHTGGETAVDFRTSQTALTLVLRMSPEFAWRILGRAVPAGRLEEVFPAARQALEKKAGTFFVLRAGETPVAPLRVRASLELDRHVAVVLSWRRPAVETLTLRAPILDSQEVPEPAVLRFLDDTGSAFLRTTEPYAMLRLASSGQTVTFSLHSASLIPP